MLSGRLRCLTCCFTYASVLLLGLCLGDLEEVKDDVIHKLVGDEVTLPSRLKDENVSFVEWRYNRSTIANKDGSAKSPQFNNRITLNPRDDFSLTVRRLTLKDSGQYSFLSFDLDDNQRETVIITLEVHEPITEEPIITSTSAWHGSNQSCTFHLVCHAADDSSLRYKWTVSNETRSGSTLQYVVWPQDGDTKVTCTVFHSASEKSTSMMVKCSNETQEKVTEPPFAGRLGFIIVLSAAGGGILLLVFVVGIIAWRCRNSKSGSDTNELTVYADITEVSDTSTMKPCSVYETIDHRETRVAPKPQTVYDQIQFSRVMKA